MADDSLPERVENPRIPVERHCIVCGTVKPAGEFSLCQYTTNQGKVSQRLDSRCKKCNAVRQGNWRGKNYERHLRLLREYRAANRETVRARVKEYRAANRDKVLLQRVISQQKRRLRGYDSHRNDVREVIETALELARIGDRFLDAYSGELIDNPTIDHIIPLSAGGTHDLDNVCITSFENNRSKRSTPLLLWMIRSGIWKS